MGHWTMGLNWEHKLKLMSVCEEASQQVKISRKKGGFVAQGEGEGR
jgi:hypothetical protein